MRVADQRDLIDGAVDRSRPGVGERFVTPRGHDVLEAASPRRAIDEVALISDPHRAIDWLSTFSQVVLVAIGERP